MKRFKSIKARAIVLSVVALIILTAASIPMCGCDSEIEESATSNYTPGTIFVDYVGSYSNLEGLTRNADLIVVGMIDGAGEKILDEATKDKKDPRLQMWLTRSAFIIERSIRGDCEQEIVVSQNGATGWAVEQENPIFEPGERCLLFLKEGEDGIYHLIHPYGRFRIEDGKVSSMNFVLPTGASRIPTDLMFWRVDLDRFIEKIDDIKIEDSTSIEQNIVIPDTKQIITMQLTQIMGGSYDNLMIFMGGTIIYKKMTGLRFGSSDTEWRQGELSEEDLGELMALFNSPEFASLDADYDATKLSGANGGVRGDMTCDLSVDYQGIKKTVTAAGYTTPDMGITYPGMPYPLNEIYRILKQIAENKTVEVSEEEIPLDYMIEYPE